MPGHLGGWGAHLLNWEAVGRAGGEGLGQCSVSCESGFQGGIPAEDDKVVTISI